MRCPLCRAVKRDAKTFSREIEERHGYRPGKMTAMLSVYHERPIDGKHTETYVHTIEMNLEEAKELDQNIRIEAEARYCPYCGREMGARLAKWRSRK